MNAEVVSSTAMVAAPCPWATGVALEVLSSGGNAVDAALAAAAMLVVTVPHQCGLGGDAFWLIRPPGGPTRVLNASGRSPQAASLDALRDRGLSRIPERSPLAVTVPGMVDGWITAHERFATRALEDLLAPAATRAREGVPITPYLATQFAAARSVLDGQPMAAAVYRPDGKPLKPGDRLVQADLARTLDSLSADPRSLYVGSLAERISAEVRRQGGWLSAEDLGAHTSAWTDPLEFDYAGVRVEEAPPNSQGVLALIALALLPPDLPASATARLHLLIEAAQTAVVAGHLHVGDPDCMRLTTAELLSDAFLESLRSAVEPGYAASLKARPRGDTAHVAVVDSDGLAVSMIQSLFYDFGSAIMIPDTGIVMQNRGFSFTGDAGDVNALAPRKLPSHTLSPALCTDDDQTKIVFGAMGGSAQPQLHLQMLEGLLVDCLAPAEVTSRPRWFVRPADAGFEVAVEDGLPVAELERLGHRVNRQGRYSELLGHEQIVVVDQERGVLIGAADPRSDGVAAGL